MTAHTVLDAKAPRGTWRASVATVMGFLLVAHPGISIDGVGVIRTVDVVCVTFVATWWLAYGRTRHHAVLLRGVLGASCSLAILWATGAMSNEPIMTLRLLEFGLIFAITFSLASQSPRLIARTAKGMTFAFGLLVALTYAQVVLWSILGWDGSVAFDRIISHFSAKETAGFVYQAGPIIRPTGTYSHPNAFAGVMGLGVAGIFGAALTLPVGRKRRRLLGLVLAGLVAIVLTSSRGAFAAVMLVGILAYVLTRRANRGRLVVAMALLGFTVMVGGLTLLPESQESYAGRITSLGSLGDDASFEGREASISTALTRVSEDPFGGHGRQRVLSELPAVHNSILFLAVVLGVLPALALMMTSLYGFALSMRAMSRDVPPVVTAAACVVLAGTVLLMIEDRPDDPAFMPIFVGGIAVIAANVPPPRRLPDSPNFES